MSALSQIRQSIKDIPPYSNSITLWITALCSLVLLIFNTSVTFLPEAYEQYILWECLTIGGSKSVNCIQVDSLLGAPLIPLLSGMLSYIFPSVIAIGIVFWFFSLCSFAIIWKLSSIIGGYLGGILSTLLFLSITLSTDILTLASPEMICTPFVITVLYFLLQAKEHTPTNLQIFTLGILLGLSYLFTTSAFLYIVAICGIAILIISKRDNIIFFLFGSMTLPSVWHFLASVYTGTLFINSRIYTGESIQTLPSTFETQILGEGIYKTSLRSIAHSEKSVSLEALIPDTIDVDILGTIELLIERIPFFLFLCAITIIRILFYERKIEHQTKYLALSVLVLFLVGLVQVACTSNQQTFLLSFLPFIAIGSLTMGIFVTQTSLPAVKQYCIPLILFTSLFMTISSTSQKIFLVEQSNSGRNMIEWISKHTSPRESIVSTRVNMPILTLANRKWVQYTSPFDDLSNLQNPPRYILISQHDNWYTGEVKGIGKITSYFFDDQEWYGIFEYSSPTK